MNAATLAPLLQAIHKHATAVESAPVVGPGRFKVTIIHERGHADDVRGVLSRAGLAWGGGLSTFTQLTERLDVTT